MKVSLPGEKQAFRSLDGDGKFSHDILALRMSVITRKIPSSRR